MKLKKFRKYFVFSKSNIMNTLAYTFNIYSWMIGSFISLILLIILWNAIYKYSNTELISCFTKQEMQTYVMFSFLASSICFCSDSFYSISEDVRDGRIAMNLIKPIDYHLKLSFEALGSFLANFLIILLPLGMIALCITTFVFHFPCPSWYQILLFIVACLFSTLLVDAFNFLFGQVAFMSTSIFGLGQIKDTILKFLSGGIIPIALFPQWARTVVSYTPFPSMITFPVMILLGKYSWIEMLEQFGISILWLMVLYSLGEICYHSSIKHLANNGG